MYKQPVKQNKAGRFCTPVRGVILEECPKLPTPPLYLSDEGHVLVWLTSKFLRHQLQFGILQYQTMFLGCFSLLNDKINIHHFCILRCFPCWSLCLRWPSIFRWHIEAALWSAQQSQYDHLRISSFPLGGKWPWKVIMSVATPWQHPWEGYVFRSEVVGFGFGFFRSSW